MRMVVLTVAGAVVALILAGLIYEAVSEAVDNRRFPPPGRLVDVGGRRLHLLCKGSAPGPTVVIEQGSASPSVIWWPVQDAVAGFARVCTYDRAGYQWSDPGPATRSLADRVADLHALLKRGEVPGPYVLVGHSFGGPLIRLFARTYPDEAAGMVLVDTPEEVVIFRKAYRDYTGQIATMAGIAGLAARLGVVRLAMNALVHPDGGLTPEMNRMMIAFMSRPSFYAGARDEMASLSRAQAETEKAGGFGALGDRPLVVITHTRPFPGPPASLEPGWQEGQKRLAALSTDAQLVEATKSSHMIQAEEPELVIDAIRRVHAAARDGARLAPQTP